MNQSDVGIAIHTEGLTKSFGNRTVVDDVNIAVDAGEVFSLLGPNGAGKTTTIRMLCCLLRPSSGTARIRGHDIGTDALTVKEVIGVSPQETAVAPNLTGWENLELMAGLNGIGRQRSRRRAAELLEVTGLTQRANDKAKKYSGGLQRRLSIAMALVSDPQVLFLDEPTVGLDPQARRGMWDYIAGLKGATTIVLRTHYLEEADALADRIAVIDVGRIVASGTPTELKDRVGGPPVMMIEASNLTVEAIEALQRVYPSARRVDGRIEITADNVSVYEVGDCLRRFGVEIRSADTKHVSLDDVFAELTGKDLRG